MLEFNQIYNMDCVDGMKQLPNDCIDLTVTSPPYDNLRNYHGYTFDFPAIARELFRVTKPGGVVVWVVSDATVNGSETGSSFRQALGFKDAGFKLHDTMIWVKTGGGGFGSIYCYMQNTEYMFILSKGKPKAVNLIRDHRNSHVGAKKSGHGRRFADGVTNTENGKMRTVPEFSKRNNWWYYPRSHGFEDHPATFPEALAGDHILSWSNPGDVVLDPFMGSGTTAKMALANGRRFIGFDISPDYCGMARRRIEGMVNILKDNESKGCVRQTTL